VRHPCSTDPVQVPVEDVDDLEFGGGHGCARTTASAALCWGTVGGEQRVLEVDVEVEQVAVGTEHLCIRTPDARILCQGSNAAGQLGLPPEERRSSTEWIELE